MKPQLDWWELGRAIGLESLWIQFGQSFPRRVFLDLGQEVVAKLKQDPGWLARYEAARAAVGVTRS